MKPFNPSLKSPALGGSADSKPLNYGIFRRVFAYTRPYRAKRNVLFVLVFLRTLQTTAVAWAMSAIINGPIAAGDVHAALWAVAALLLLMIFTEATVHFRQRLAWELGEAVVHDLRGAMFQKMLAMPLAFFTQTRLGRFISLFSSDAEAVRSGIQNVVFAALAQIGSMLTAAAVMLYADWQMFLVVLAIGPVVWLINRYFRVKLINAYRAIQESFSRVTTTVAESIKGIKIIQSYSRQELNAELFRELVYDHSTYNVVVARLEASFMPLLEVNSQFFLSALLLFGGARLLHHDMSLESFILFFFLSGHFFSPITGLAGQYQQALAAIAGAERLFQFLDRSPDSQDAPQAVAWAGPTGQVEFRKVSFSYKPDRPVLEDITFAATPGQTIALVGPTGGGKTTLTNLIAKFYLPNAGEILIDGRNILEIKQQSLRRHLGVVGQSNFLFTGTVMSNILVGKPGATEEEAREATSKINCLDLIEALPDGFQTAVTENGVGLSLGQRQIICLSRAMLADPKILILDEATSSVDAVTEERLQQALAQLLSHRTSFVIAHRLSTVRKADLVLVIEKGRIIERGNHRQLLRLGGVYARLYKEFKAAGEI
ncbi:MAG: ABC transporter ATP-binding protein [Lentisphaerae bacterium]|nr:ABC transporter ATP-binding protein [Lentisphaerota bacterium]